MQDNVEFIDNYPPNRIYKDLLTSDCCGLSILALRKSSGLRSCSDIFSEESGRFLRNYISSICMIGGTGFFNN